MRRTLPIAVAMAAAAMPLSPPRPTTRAASRARCIRTSRSSLRVTATPWKTLKAGTYTIKIEDKSRIHDFHLVLVPAWHRATTCVRRRAHLARHVQAGDLHVPVRSAPLEDAGRSASPNRPTGPQEALGNARSGVRVGQEHPLRSETGAGTLAPVGRPRRGAAEVDERAIRMTFMARPWLRPWPSLRWPRPRQWPIRARHPYRAPAAPGSAPGKPAPDLTPDLSGKLPKGYVRVSAGFTSTTRRRPAAAARARRARCRSAAARSCPRRASTSTSTARSRPATAGPATSTTSAARRPIHGLRGLRQSAQEVRDRASGAFTSPANGQASRDGRLPGEDFVLGGGSLSASGSVAVNINSSFPSGNGWRTDQNTNTSAATTFNVYAICGKKPKGYVLFTGAAGHQPGQLPDAGHVGCGPGRSRSAAAASRARARPRST